MKPEECKSCDNLLDQVKMLVSQNAELRDEVKALKSTNFIRLRADLEEKELQVDCYRKTLEYIAEGGKLNPIEVACKALHDEKCPSTYRKGEFKCEKDKGHLNRRNDVPHQGGGQTWLSI